MKKKNFQSLKLNKESIASFKGSHIKGGGSTICTVTRCHKCNVDPLFPDSLTCPLDSCACPSVIEAC